MRRLGLGLCGRGKELAPVLHLLCEASSPEVEKHRIELRRVNAGRFPATVKITRLVFCGHKTPVYVQG